MAKVKRKTNSKRKTKTSQQDLPPQQSSHQNTLLAILFVGLLLAVLYWDTFQGHRLPPSPNHVRGSIIPRVTCHINRQGPSHSVISQGESFQTKHECAQECNNLRDCARFDYIPTDPQAQCRYYDTDSGGSTRASHDRSLCFLNQSEQYQRFSFTAGGIDSIDQENDSEDTTAAGTTAAGITAAGTTGGGQDELALIHQFVKEGRASSASRATSLFGSGGGSKKKIRLTKTDDFMLVVLKHWGRHEVQCLRRKKLIKTLLEEHSTTAFPYYPPVVYSQVILDKYRTNNRQWYRQVGESLTLAVPAESGAKATATATVPTKAERQLIDDMLLEPYDNSRLKKEPYPALCVFTNAAVDYDGNVCSASRKCLQSRSCQQAYGKYSTSGPSHDVVYSIAEMWGFGFFHYMCENFVRLFVGLDYLKSKEGGHVKIHVVQTNKFVVESMAAMGIATSRLITTATTLRANVVILPEPVGCGSPSKKLVQLTRSLVFTNVLAMFQHDINRFNQKDSGTTLFTKDRPLVVTVMKRKGARSVKNHGALIQELIVAFQVQEQDVPFKIVEFKNKLSMKQSVDLFASSDIVVGPHGAGLSNLLYMQPGRSVLELLAVAHGQINACYMYLALKLGLRYYTWSHPKTTHHGSMTIDTTQIVRIVTQMKDDLIGEGGV